MQIGVDFGGTKLEVAALDHQGRFMARRRTPNPGVYELAIEAICDLISDIEAETGKTGTVGVGLPGSVSRRSQTMRNANSTWLNGRSFREDFERALQREIRMANDANCLALSEASDGATQGAEVAFAVILGTGCGGGLTVKGGLVEGFNGIAGEWGHNPLPWANAEEVHGPECWCGKEGCLETWISGPGMARDYRQSTGETLDAAAIAEAARAGDAAAQAAVDRLIDRLGRAIAVVCNIVDPDVIVVGGGLSNIEDIYERAPEIVRRYVFSDAWDAKIVPAKWGDSSGVRGAARLWPVKTETGLSARNKAAIAASRS